MSFQKALSQPFNVLWRSALVKLPRAVPKEALYFTCPNGPHPIVINLKSRGNYEIPVYVFVPRSITPSSQDPVPVVIDFHGGGFFLGSCLEQGPFCVKLANALHAIVISVDYRMAPFDKFPAPVEDAEDVLNAILKSSAPGYDQLRQGIRDKILKRWKDSNKKSSKDTIEKVQSLPSVSHIDIDTTKLAFSGFSSGGNLAMNMGISVRESEDQKAWPCPIPDDYQHPFALILYYPAIDLRLLPSERTKPPKLPASKGFWSEMNDMLAPTYLPRSMASNHRASPGLAPVTESLHPQARLQFVLAEIDDLTSQNDAWISEASKAGRSDDVVVERYEGMTHGWTQMPETWLDSDQRRTREEAFQKTIMFIKTTWAGKSFDELRRGNFHLSAVSGPFARMQHRGKSYMKKQVKKERKDKKENEKKSARSSMESNRATSPEKSPRPSSELGRTNSHLMPDVEANR